MRVLKVNKSQEIIQKVQNYFKRTTRINVPKNKIKFIIDRYYDMAIDAALNGYIVSTKRPPRDAVKIYLVYEPVRLLTLQEHKVYRKSKYFVEYIFRLVIEGKGIKKGFMWIPNDKTMKKLEETINSETVYQLVKK